MKDTSTEEKNEVIEKRYFSIAYVSRELNVTSSCLRFWCKEIGIKPSRSHITNNRRFTKEDIELLHKVKNLSDSGIYTIVGIKWALEAELKTKR